MMVVLREMLKAGIGSIPVADLISVGVHISSALSILSDGSFDGLGHFE